MTAATVTTTCPAWCDSPHDQDNTLHYQDDTAVPVVDSTLNVSPFIHRDRVGVCLEGFEMSPDQARVLAAKLVEAAALAEGR